jgi:hypothetical protein
MIVVVYVHILLHMEHSNEMLSVLAELGTAADLPNTLGRPECRRCQVIAKELSNRVQHEHVCSGNDSKNRQWPVDSLALDSTYRAYDARILSRPIFFTTGSVTGDLLEIGQT